MKTVLEYKGYRTTVEHDKEEGIYHGVLEGIIGLITWMSDTEEECEDAFRDAVDDYLNFCHSRGEYTNPISHKK